MRVELKNHRTPNCKYYLNDDKTIKVELFKENVHYLNNNEYIDIDNSLVEKNNKLENKSNSFKIVIDKKSKEINIKNSNNYIKIRHDSDKEFEIEYDKKEHNKLIEKFIFKDIYNNCDINYEIHPNHLKEFIILNKKTNMTLFKYYINTNLDVKLTKKNTVEFLNNKKVIYELEKPFMFDKNNEKNEGVVYSINKVDKEYELQISLDDKWIKSDERKYPIIIDPTVTEKDSTTSLIDTFIYNGDTNDTTYNLPYLDVGVDNRNNNLIYRTLLKFELPAIPSSYKLVSADLCLYSYLDDTAIIYPNCPRVAVHRITQNWTESGAKWSNMNDKYDSNLEDYFQSGRTNGQSDPVILFKNQSKITRIVKDWYNGKYPNYGLLLKDILEQPLVDGKQASFFSKDHGLSDIDPKPIIEFTYKNFNGLEGYLSYNSQNHYFGTSNVSNFTGNLTTTFDVANTVGGELPANISLIYNTNDVILNNDYGYGLGIKPNLIQIIRTTILEDTPLEYVDEDGTIHYFYQNSEDNKYYDEDGLGLNIELSNNNYILKDKDGNQSTFVNHSGTYYLEEIRNTNNKIIAITYDSSNKITKITDGSSKEINITYNSNSILFTSPHKTTTINLTNNLLTSITSLGDTETISYTTNNLIEYINNPDGTKLKFEYTNDLINKVSKVTEYGRNNSEGNYLIFNYNLTDTKVTDRKGFINTYLFNDNGNVIGTTNLDNTNNLSNAYGKSYSFGSSDNDINKLTNDKSLVKYVNNFINDSSFEGETNTFICSSSVIKSYVSDARSGIKALKFTINQQSSTPPTITNTFSNLTLDNYYTYSTYIKGNGSINVELTDGTITTNKTFQLTNEYERISVTEDFSNSNNTSLTINITNITSTEITIDDMQLEKNEVANYYNIIDNSSFSNGTNGWNITTINSTSYSVVNVDSNTKALKIHSDPDGYVEIQKEFNISGQAGDTFNLSFWYKNNGIPASGYIMEQHPTMCALLDFQNSGSEYGSCIPARPLNIGNDNWQFFSENFTTQENYTKLVLQIESNFNANDCLFTNFSLFKDLESYSYTYDENGNLVSTVDLNKEQNTMNYDKNNQLLSNLTPLGANYTYEYDNNVKDRLVRSISPTGITNEINYDSNGNPIRTRISNKKTLDNIVSGNSYYIRSKGTNRYIDINPDKTLKTIPDECSHDKFNIILLQNNQLKIQNTLLNNYYIKEINNSLQINYGDNNNTFVLIENTNKSYSFRSLVSNKVITINSSTFELSLDIYEVDNEYQEFYLESPSNKLYIESSATYTNDGRFIDAVTNELGYTTTYNINTTNGLISSITDANNTTTNYTYDNKLRVTNISKGNHSVSYTYDTNNNLSKITHGTKEYSFVYDDFNNPLIAKINNNTLITNNTEINNGNIIGIVFGNNDEIDYTYDNQDRLKKIIKNNDTYTNYYDNLGRITNILSTYNKYEFEYDFAKRLSKYNFNDYISTYDYNKENYIIKKSEKYNNNSHEYNYTYNHESALTNIVIDNININYTYDYLGRLQTSNINNSYNTTYSYITTGRKTSTIINKVNDNNNIYNYEYDSLNNITKNYLNNNLTNEYTYDIYNELIEEKDHINNIKTTYTYDNYGNILTASKYNLTNNNLISTDTYSYNNSNWSDLLTSFNNNSITYDNIGNPLTIGNKTLTWMNGRELATYSDGTNNISFKYNERGIRTSKIINNIETKYYLEGKNIIFEDRNGTILYYIRNGQELLGFIYNNNTYYYHKNVFRDIIGILDSNYNEIVTYSYDSWGSIINITDTSNINLSTINPFRYRSYYYDNETGLYYLNARYYNPLWRRFINADSYISTGQDINGHNMFQYCLNNPVKNYETGEFIIGKLIALAVGTIIINQIRVNIKASKEIQNVQKKYSSLSINGNNKEFDKLLHEDAYIAKKKNSGKDIIEKSVYIYKKSDNYSDYDLKMKKNWEKPIYYDGYVMESQDIGNYHFGYICAALGIPLVEAIGGAGIIQFRDHVYPAKEEVSLGSRIETILQCPTISFCDDPRDTFYIIRGYNAYKRDNTFIDIRYYGQEKR